MRHLKAHPSALRQAAVALALTTPLLASAQITIYENEAYGGRSYTTQTRVDNLRDKGFNDRASSAVVRSSRWEICENSSFGGRCTVLRPGQYPSLAAMGLNDRVSSVRAVYANARVDEQRYAPEPAVQSDYRRRREELLFEAPVSSARAVFGASQQRCWMEREEVRNEGSDKRVPGALIGAVIGGILGHQVGGGTGRDIATVGGAVAGGVVGANVGRNRDAPPITSREVQRCKDAPGPAPVDYWDVTYDFRGTQHRVQLATQPGPTITVNRAGEPRA